jgi:hypothetical protein
MKKDQKNSKDSIFKTIRLEIRDSILFELMWSIISFIPKFIVRLIRNIY